MTTTNRAINVNIFPVKISDTQQINIVCRWTIHPQFNAFGILSTKFCKLKTQTKLHLVQKFKLCEINSQLIDKPRNYIYLRS